MNFFRKKNNVDELNNIPTKAKKRSMHMIQISFRTKRPNLRQHNLESASKITADPRSTMFSKSANPLVLRHKSTIRALFKAKSVVSKTYSPPQIGLLV